MAKVFVHGGQCEKETIITARKSSPTECGLEFESTCEHIQELAEELKSVNAGSEMTLPLRALKSTARHPGTAAATRVSSRQQRSRQ